VALLLKSGNDERDDFDAEQRAISSVAP